MLVAINMDNPLDIPDSLYLDIQENNNESKKKIDEFYLLCKKYKNAEIVVHVCEEMRPYFNKVFSSFNFVEK